MQRRLFTAINLPEDVKQNLITLESSLKRQGSLHWTPPENLHITLHFFGWVEEATEGQIERVLGKIVPAYTPMRLVLHKLGAFPNWKDPRILWVGVRDADTGKLPKALTTLQKELAEEFQRLGLILEDRLFTPHITLARIKGHVELLAYQVEVAPRAFVANSMDIMESTLRGGGARYTIRKTFPFFS